MDKNAVIEKIKELIAAPSVYAGLKEVAEKYLGSIGSAEEKANAKTLIDALGECVQTIDSVIAFFGSADAEKIFGEETAKNYLAHMKEVKAKGGKYCDCPACSAGVAILSNKSAIL